MNPAERYAAVWLVALAIALAAAPVARAETPGQASFDESLKPLFTKYCVACHGPAKQKAALTLHDKAAESLRGDETLTSALIERLERSEMPPKGQPQPSADQRKAAIAWLKAEPANTPKAAANSRPPTLRRLNRAEYNNTIRDLLALDFHPADDFPADDVGYGFDNIGDVLALSPLLMEKYLAAAETIVDQAFTGTLPPLPPKRDIRPRQLTASAKTTPGPERSVVFTEGELSVTHAFPRDGDYVFLYRALGRRIDDEPVRLAIKIDGEEKYRTELRPYADGRSAPDREIKIAVKGGSRRISFVIVNPHTNPDSADPKKRERAIYFGPLEIRGPLVPLDKIMPEAYRRIMIAKPGRDGSSAECARKIIAHFARQAFRRSPTKEEIDRLAKLVELAERQGDGFERGIQLAVEAILVSPHFLFKVEANHADVNKPFAISEYELATRLSYFLWSSCPDDELAGLADRGQLRAHLDSQVRRMLLDPKAHALAENFAGQWLQIRNIKAMSPDRSMFPHFDEALRSAMIQETTLFFESMMRENRPLGDFLTAKYTFVNERLAKLYGLPGVRGSEFRRVSLEGTPRAGILTQAAVLAVTSNVTRTSPVKRGKFIMENILNVDVPPPPPNVPELIESKDAVQSGSLRKRMEVHRINPDCAVCHQKMDPIGFAFENFDAIGAWRTKDGAFEIDPSGTLPDGRSFRNPTDLRRLLAEDPRPFRLCLAEKLLTYALGRGIEKRDRPIVAAVAEQTARRGDTLTALVLAIAESEAFQTRPAVGR